MAGIRGFTNLMRYYSEDASRRGGRLWMMSIQRKMSVESPRKMSMYVRSIAVEIISINHMSVITGSKSTIVLDTV